MNQKVIKELQKLMALCMEINEKAEHEINFYVNGMLGKQKLSVYVYENGYYESKGQDIAMACQQPITLPNINKCRKKLLKYKEW